MNNAYEVLSDPEKRKVSYSSSFRAWRQALTSAQVYDQHGVWPPPQPTAVPPSSQPGFDSSFFRPPPFTSGAPFGTGPNIGAGVPPTEDPFFTTPLGPRPFFQFVNLHDPHDIFRQFFGTADPFGFPQQASPFGPQPPFRSMSPGPFPPSLHDMFSGFHHDPFHAHHTMFGQHVPPIGHRSPVHHHHVPPLPSVSPFGMFPDLGPVIPKFVTDDDFFGPTSSNPMHASSTFTQFSFTSSGPSTGHSSRDQKHESPAIATSFSRSTRSDMGATWTEELTRDSHGDEHLVITYPEGFVRYKRNGVERPAAEIENVPKNATGGSSWRSKFVPGSLNEPSNGKKLNPVIPRKVTLDGPPPEIPTGPLPQIFDEDEVQYANGYAPGWKDGWTTPVPPGPEPAQYPMHEHVPSHGMHHRPEDDHVYAARERYKAELARARATHEHVRAESPRLANEHGKHRARRDEHARKQWEEEGRRMGWIDEDGDDTMDGEKGHKRWWSMGKK